MSKAKIITHFSSKEKSPLRFYPTNNCNYKCRTPFSTEFCDHQYSSYKPSYNDLLEIFRLFHEANLTDIAKISGREPTLYSQLLPLVNGLKNRAKKITLSTNGYGQHEIIYKAVDNGVSLVTLPIPSLDRKKYGFFTGLPEEKAKNSLKKILDLIENLYQKNVELHFIRILLKDFNDSLEDMNSYMRFSKKYNATMKVFDLNFHHNLDKLIKGKTIGKHPETIWKDLYVSTESWRRKFLRESVETANFSSNFSCRNISVMVLKNGLKVLMDDFSDLKKKEFSLCEKCKHIDYCREGPFSNGWEIRPDLKLQICPLREDLTLDLSSPQKIKRLYLEGENLTIER